jgi:hypothetical protein
MNNRAAVILLRYFPLVVEERRRGGDKEDRNNPYVLWRRMTGTHVIFASSFLRPLTLRNVPPKFLKISIVFDRN